MQPSLLSRYAELNSEPFHQKGHCLPSLTSVQGIAVAVQNGRITTDPPYVLIAVCFASPVLVLSSTYLPGPPRPTLPTGAPVLAFLHCCRHIPVSSHCRQELPPHWLLPRAAVSMTFSHTEHRTSGWPSALGGSPTTFPGLSPHTFRARALMAQSSSPRLPLLCSGAAFQLRLQIGGHLSKSSQTSALPVAFPEGGGRPRAGALRGASAPPQSAAPMNIQSVSTSSRSWG